MACKITLNSHPCFDADKKHTHSRIHLPVAPRCNIQCKFCNRKFDCLNESRPGVSSRIMTPVQAVEYLKNMANAVPNLSVVGIAGPGDPFANPEETLETLRLVREWNSDILLCVASNGLNVAPYVPFLASTGVSHVTITVNAVDPEIGEKIYAYVRIGKHSVTGRAAAETLLKAQTEAIKLLKEAGILVKINTIVIPGINDNHVLEVTKYVKELGVDMQNCMALYPNKDSSFGHLKEPPAEQMAEIRAAAGEILPQMMHCARCRADAAGIIGQDVNNAQALEDASNIKEESKALKQMTQELSKPGETFRIAIASREGWMINSHLGEAKDMRVYEIKDGKATFIERRATPLAGGGDNRWISMASIFSDCNAIVVGGAGDTPRKVLADNNIKVFVLEGLIEDALKAFSKNQVPLTMIKREAFKCGSGGCTGTGAGCA